VFPPPAGPAAGDHDGVAVGRQVAQEVPRRRVEHGGSDRHPDGEVGTRPSFFPAAGAVLPVAGRELGALDKRGKVVEVAGRPQHDIAAGAAVAAVGTALRLERLGPEGRRAASATARADAQRDGVSEHPLS